MARKAIKILIPLSVLFFLLWTILNNGPYVLTQITNANLSLIFLSVFLLGLTYLGGAYLFFLIIKNFSHVNFGEVFRIFIVSNFGRFIPGVALHYIARVYLAKSLGLSVSERISAVVLEAYYTLLGGVIVALLALPMLIKMVNSPEIIILVMFGLLAVICLTPPRFAFILASKIPVLGRYVPSYKEKNRNLRDHLKMVGVSVSLFLIYGTALNIFIQSLTGDSIFRYFELTGLLSASWVLGFLTPIAPGGLGVSDLSFAVMLQSFYDVPLASFIALTFRFLLFIAEGIMFLLVLKLSNFDIVNFKKMAQEHPDE